MDHIDRLLADQDNAERGPDLKDAIEFTPDQQLLLKAGTKLNEALDLFERTAGPRITIEKLLARIRTIQTRNPRP